MKQQDIRALSTEKLLEMRGQLRAQQMTQRFGVATGQEVKTHLVQEVRKDIARLETELSARRLTIPAKKGKSTHA